MDSPDGEEEFFSKLEKTINGRISEKAQNKIIDDFEKLYKEEYHKNINLTEIYDKLSNRNYDLQRLSNALKNFSLDKEDEFKIIEKYLLKDYDLESFENLNSQKIELDLYTCNHEDNKVFVPILTDEFITENSRIIKGDNRKVNINLPDNEKIKCLI